MSTGSLVTPVPREASAPRLVSRHYGLLVVGLLVTLVHLGVFWILCSTNSWDHGPHIETAGQLIRGQKWLPYFGYHLTVGVLSGWHTQPNALAWAATVALTLATVARALISYQVLDPDGVRPIRAMSFSVALLFAMPLWNWWKFPKVYLGQVTPNAWHNPTLTFAMPFALALFLLALRYLRRPSCRAAVCVGLMMVLSTLAKPNYVIAFAPCFAAILGARLVVAVLRGEADRWSRLIEVVLMFCPIVAVLGLQYLTSYAAPKGEAVRIIVAPWQVWSMYTPNIPASIILGIAFPLIVVALYPTEALANRAMLFAWAILVVAIAQFALLGEEQRMHSGNFAWGCYMANYIVFLLCCKLLMRQPLDLRFRLASTILTLHAIAGSLHLAAYVMEPVRTVVPD